MQSTPYDAWVHLGDYIYEYGPGGYEEAEDAAGSRQFALTLAKNYQQILQYYYPGIEIKKIY